MFDKYEDGYSSTKQISRSNFLNLNWLFEPGPEHVET